MKKLISLLLALAIVMGCTAAFAADAAKTKVYDESFSDERATVTPFKFEHMKHGIGKGVCPVYTAPYEGAYRAANGKASVDTNSNLDVGGYSAQGWLLVRYSTNNGGTRVGWIPPKYIKGVVTAMAPHFFHIEQTAEEDLQVSDNNLSPYDPSSIIGTIAAGETYYIVGRYNYYNYDLWYVEFYIDEEIAWGFIEVEE